MMRAEQATPSTRTGPAPVAFEVNEFYEKILSQRAADGRRYELSYSPATRRAAEAYEQAKAKHSRETGV